MGRRYVPPLPEGWCLQHYVTKGSQVSGNLMRCPTCGTWLSIFWGVGTCWLPAHDPAAGDYELVL